MRLYAIGDIHGQLEMLRTAHDRILADRQQTGDDAAPVVHLGDFCDRGTDTAGVIGYLAGGLAAGAPWRMLLGNHDRMFRMFLDDPGGEDPRLRAGLTWFDHRLGGVETLRSYGLDTGGGEPEVALKAAARAAVPAAHRTFLDSLEPCIETDDLILVHAGIRPGVPVSAQAEDDLVWIRDPFLMDTRDHGKLVVHGHTALEDPTHFGNRVDLDSGAGYFRPLTVAVFEGRTVHVLGERGRVPLVPPG